MCNDAEYTGHAKVKTGDASGKNTRFLIGFCPAYLTGATAPTRHSTFPPPTPPAFAGAVERLSPSGPCRSASRGGVGTRSRPRRRVARFGFGGGLAYLVHQTPFSVGCCANLGNHTLRSPRSKCEGVRQATATSERGRLTSHCIGPGLYSSNLRLGLDALRLDRPALFA